MVGIYHFISYASMTYYFRDPMLLVSGILNVLLGVLLLFMPVELTAQVITFLLAFLLIFNGGEKLSLASRLRYYRIEGIGFLSFCGVLCITLAVVFLLLPFVSALGSELHSGRISDNNGCCALCRGDRNEPGPVLNLLPHKNGDASESSLSAF